MKFGSIEAGGTKFVCAVADEQLNKIDETIIKTTTPEETLSKVIDYFKPFGIASLGVASFGPIEIRKTHPKYGWITKTPKEGWSNCDVIGTLKKELNIPMTWTTDVNGSAYGEYQLNKEQDEHIHSLVYYTVGTGVGGGAVIDGDFLGGSGHPEMGHTLVKRHPDDHFQGGCPFHHDCLEGLIAGPTLEQRLGVKGETLSDDDDIWEIYAYYLAQAAMQATLLIRPDKIVFGGSVVRPSLLEKTKKAFKQLMNDYVELPDLDDYLTRPLAKNNGSATLGNFFLAKNELLK